jgi:hypothetical protein
VEHARRLCEKMLSGMPIERVAIETSSSHAVVVGLYPTRGMVLDEERLWSFLRNDVIQGIAVFGTDDIKVLGDARVQTQEVHAMGPEGFLSSGLFRQSNQRANRLLVNQVMERLAAMPSDHLLELFAGSGNFTFPVSAGRARVPAVGCCSKI